MQTDSASPPADLFNRLTQRLRDDPHQLTYALIGLSLLVRLLVWIPVAVNRVPPLLDEKLYTAWAASMVGALLDALRGAAPASELGQAYVSGAFGWWPPLNAVLIALGLLIGRTVATGRLITVILSAITTGVVHRLTLKLGSQRAALIAALLHLLMPRYIAFSHLLWAETPYILWLMLAALHTVSLLDAADDPRAARRHAVWAGVFLGLGGLTRASILAYLAFVPGWVFLTRVDWRQRLALPAIITVMWLIVGSVWIVPLSLRVGRVAPFSALGPMSMYWGNNPLIREGQTHNREAETEALLRNYAAKHHVDQDTAAREIALATIQADPAGAVLRAALRYRRIHGFDLQVMRHILSATYPPMPGWIAVLIWIGLVLTQLLLIPLIVGGWLAERDAFRHRLFMLGLYACALAPHLVGHGQQRHGLALYALLIPIAGIGADTLRAGLRDIRRLALGGAATLLLWWMLLSTLGASVPGEISTRYLSLYRRGAPAIRLVQRSYGLRDQMRLRLAPDDNGRAETLTLRLTSSAYAFESNGSQTRRVQLRPGGTYPVITIVGKDATRPPALIVEAEPGQMAEVSLADVPWRSWTPLGVGDAEVFWHGSLPTYFDEDALTLLADP